MTSTFPSAAPLPVVPAIETDGQSFLLGWLFTTRDALLRPTLFYSQLGRGSLRTPFAFAVLSLALPVLIADFGGYVWGISGQPTPLTALTLLRSLLSPLAAAAVLIVVQALLWTAVTRMLGARVSLDVALRAMAYLTSIATTFGVVMTLAGFAPESAFCVILWYASMNVAYLFASYASYRLARGAYGFRPVRAGLTVWLYQISLTLLGVGLIAVYSAVNR